MVVEVIPALSSQYVGLGCLHVFSVTVNRHGLVGFICVCERCVCVFAGMVCVQDF